MHKVVIVPMLCWQLCYSSSLTFNFVDLSRTGNVHKIPPINGTPKGFGFCEFESAEGVLLALRLLSKLNVDGQELLSKLYPRLIQDVQFVIKDLENVTVLWEELWLSTLQDLHADVMRCVNLLKEEAARIAENVTLSHSEKIKINSAKYSAMMAPIFVALERRLASTSWKPETPHEIWFHDEYAEQLKSAILNFKTPPASAAALGDVWRPFDNIAASLASYQRKSSISLGEVAPNLTRLSSSDVPMPGLEKQITMSDSDGSLSTPQGIVTIASFTEQLAILSTKTKPKKLVILGSQNLW